MACESPLWCQQLDGRTFKSLGLLFLAHEVARLHSEKHLMSQSLSAMGCHTLNGNCSRLHHIKVTFFPLIFSVEICIFFLYLEKFFFPLAGFYSTIGACPMSRDVGHTDKVCVCRCVCMWGGGHSYSAPLYHLCAFWYSFPGGRSKLSGGSRDGAAGRRMVDFCPVTDKNDGCVMMTRTNTHIYTHGRHAKALFTWLSESFWHRCLISIFGSSLVSSSASKPGQSQMNSFECCCADC